MIYADHAATTAMSSVAYEAMLPWLQNRYGNPSTLYSLARDPRKAVVQSREVIANAIHANPSEIFFTSGGTEADNWALKGTLFQHERGKGIITSAIEHHAILNSCAALERMGYSINMLPVDHEGVVNADALRSTLASNTVLVSVMLLTMKSALLNLSQNLRTLLIRWAFYSIQMLYRRLDTFPWT